MQIYRAKTASFISKKKYLGEFKYCSLNAKKAKFGLVLLNYLYWKIYIWLLYWRKKNTYYIIGKQNIVVDCLFILHEQTTKTILYKIKIKSRIPLYIWIIIRNGIMLSYIHIKKFIWQKKKRAFLLFKNESNLQIWNDVKGKQSCSAP